MTTTTTHDGNYAARKVSELQATAAAMFDQPSTQETLKNALETHLAESVALNQAPVREAEAQRERQTARIAS